MSLMKQLALKQLRGKPKLLNIQHCIAIFSIFKSLEHFIETGSKC